MSIEYHAQFLLDKEKDNPTTAKLRFRIKWNTYIVAFNVGYRIEIDKWSTDTQRCKINTTHGKKKNPATIINKKIQIYELACEKVFKKFEITNVIPTDDEFRNAFNIEIGRKVQIEDEKSLFEIYDQFIFEESKNSQWTSRTIAKIETQKNHLLKFDPQLKFEHLTEKKLFDYQYFLQNDLEHKSATVLKQFSILKWFLRWSIKRGYTKDNAFELFKPKLKSTQKKIIFLTQSELIQLKNFKIPSSKKHLEKIRDVFLFQCFTGLRYSDVYNLRRSDIKENHIEITTVKTSDSLIIEFNDNSKAILDKYKDNIFEEERALPVISNQKMNDYLKVLMELVGIDEPIRETYYKGNERIDLVTPKYALMGTHAGRRTFICNALSLGIPPHVVMKWTGHSDYQSMKPYIDIADEIKVSAMERFNSF